MILPDLSKRIAWYQEHLRPEDEAHGVGIAEWEISCEYVADLSVDGAPVWGLMCSPSSLPAYRKLLQEDIASKRAHIVIRTPTSASELAEVDRTLFHELGHVLAAKLNLPRDAEEEVMHSLDHLFSKLTPEEGIALARAIRDPMARAYRAPDKEGSMPDPTEEKKPDKPPMAQDGGDKKPMMQVRPVAEIEADLIKAVLSGQPTDELAKELVAAKAMSEATGPASDPAPPVAPTMGMKPEDQAYARAAREATKEAIEAIVDANPHLSDPQRAMVRAQGTAKAARELVATYPRPSSDKPTMGLPSNPRSAGDKAERPLARAMREAENASPRLRKVLGLGSLERDGVHVEPGGGILVYIDGTEQLAHQRAVYTAKRRSA